jgi:hypothetical protein
MFARVLVLAVCSFVALFVVHTLVVVNVPMLGGKDSVTFLVGFVRPIKPPCLESMSDAECIKVISFDITAIESFWGDKQMRLAKIALILPYLLFTSSFAMTIGILLLQDQKVKKRS